MDLNISSLQYYLDELSDLIDKSKTKFSVIGITESHLNKDIAPLRTFKTITFSIHQQSLIKEILYCISHQTSVTKLEMI